MTIQELVDKLLLVPREIRETREVVISTNNFHLEAVYTAHWDAVGDVILNAEAMVAQRIREL